MRPCLGVSSCLPNDDSVGVVASEEGFRRKAMVGGILRDERIIVVDM